MTIQTEWLILADAAQVVAGKLFLLGGGWDTLHVNQTFPIPKHMAFAASYIVPWNDTNQKHNVEIEVCTDDGASIVKVNGQLEAGRPPGIPVGTDQRAQIAAELNLEFKLPGVYFVVSKVEGQEDKRVSFRVQGGN